MPSTASSGQEGIHPGSAVAVTRRTVLVVDDDPDTLDVIATAVEDAGYDVMRAANGQDALRQLHESRGRCDLILLDLMMPVMNGWAFRHRQRDTPAFARIPVFLMSAGAHLPVVREELQASGCVAKPVDLAEILEVVRQHCPLDAARATVADVSAP